MTKLRITLLVLAVFVVGTLTPTAARAIINYEEGATFIFGRQQLIVREDGWWDGEIRDDFADFLRAAGARNVIDQPVGLDEAVNAILGQHHAAPR